MAWNFGGDGEIISAKGMQNKSAIARAIMEQARKASNLKDVSTTFWVELGYDDSNTYACAMCWCDADAADYMGFEDDPGDFVIAKIAFCPNNSLMHEYDFDWLMPYDDRGNVDDTELIINDASDADALAEAWLTFMDSYNAEVESYDDDVDFM